MKRTATVAVAGAVPVQVKLAVRRFPEVELEVFTQVPEVVEIFQGYISASICVICIGRDIELV